MYIRMSRISLIAAAVLAAASLSLAQAAKSGPALDTDDQKALYAVGMMVGGNLGTLMITEAELPYVIAGFQDAVLKHDAKIDMDAFRPRLNDFAQAREAKHREIEKQAGLAFLDKAAKENGAVKTDSGMVYVSIKEGTGASPAATDKVKVHYHGTLTDGSVFDSSVQRGTPAEFPLNGVIPCWTEGVQKMKIGGKAKLVCPSDLAYGDRGFPPKIKPGSTLVFEVELLEIVPPAPAAAP